MDLIFIFLNLFHGLLDICFHLDIKLIDVISELRRRVSYAGSSQVNHLRHHTYMAFQLLGTTQITEAAFLLTLKDPRSELPGTGTFKGTVQRDFRLLFFSSFKPAWATE